jgi:hypothetical protein
MKKANLIISVLAISISLLCASCIDLAAKEIKGNGKLITKSIPISKFSKIKIETFVEVDYSQERNDGNLEFTVDENLFEYYDIYTSGDALYIKLKKEYKCKTCPKPTSISVKVSSEKLQGIEIAGNAKFYFITAFTSDELNISLAGSGKIVANQYPVNIEDCKVEIAGSGGVQFAGAVKYANIEIAGSGSVTALDCKIATLKVDIAGSGNVEAHVTDKLKASIAGSGNVKFTGDPDVKTDIAGSGKVKKL